MSLEYKTSYNIKKLSKAVYDSEKFFIEPLSIRLKKVIEAYPNDSCAISMHNFLTKKASTNDFISRNELKIAYNKFYSRNSHVSDVFVKELGPEEIAGPKFMERSANENQPLPDVSDPVIKNALSEIFKANGKSKVYSEKVAQQAIKICKQELNYILPAKNIEVVAGQEDLIICRADWDTPKGKASTMIPIEIKENNVLLPSVFLNRFGFEDLSKEALKKHVIDTAGEVFQINAGELLKTVSLIKNGHQQPMSDVDMIIAKTKFAQNKDYSVNGIYNQEIIKIEQEEIQDNPEIKEFEKRLSTVNGVAEFKFGKAVDVSKKIVKKALSDLGFAQAKLVVANLNDDTIFYTASIDNKVAFNIPVKIHNKNPEYPTMIISAGKIYSFSEKGLADVFASNEIDNKALAYTSPVHGQNPRELLDVIKTAANDGNFLAAEDALNVIQQSGDYVTFKEAFDLYKECLSGRIKTASASNDSCCSMQRKVAHSKYVLCGHTNLPLHKVYQDKHGNCLPVYRKNIQEPEGGTFIHNKVIWS